MAILITGGAGFVGLNLAEQLLGRGETVVLYDRIPPPEGALRAFSALSGKLHAVAGDVLDGAALARALNDHGVRALVHGAAVTAGVAREKADARSIARVNLLGTIEVLEAARAHGVGRILHLSTGSVYGRNAFVAGEIDEGATPPSPESLYGISKYAGERTALRYKALSGLDLVVARLGAVFGRWEYDTGVRDTLSPTLLATRVALAGHEAVLSREGRRDWIYASDIAEGLIRLLALEHPRHEVYHVSPGRSWTLADWCARLKARFPRFSYRIAADPSEATVELHGARDRSPLSCRRLAEETGFRARFGLDEAFADFMDWLARNPDQAAPARR
ncbi:MAG: NAD(P)-dependent oxidoreductase [Proteobacteria bacterium]|nr:NAD(P)-dependent oxidoreductase [Pseudomonadota bacterium]